MIRADCFASLPALGRQVFSILPRALFCWCLAALLTPAVARAEALTKRLQVQPIQVWADSGTQAANSNRVLFQAETAKIFAQAGLAVEFLPWNSFTGSVWLDLSSSVFSDYSVFSLSNIPGHGQHPDPRVLNLWFVRSIGGGGFYGQSWQTRPGSFERNGVALAENIFSFNNGTGRVDVVAHELGHNLGLDHDTFGAGAQDNLMSANRQVPDGVQDVAPDGARLDVLNAEQIAQARSVSFVTEPFFLIHPSNQLARLGGAATFQVMAGASRPVMYQWRLASGLRLGWSTNSSLVLSNLSETAIGEYGVVVSNVFGAATSVVARLSLALDWDQDGLPDAWEVANGLNPDRADDADSDEDGDGLSNRDEFFSGTDPRSAFSSFRVESAILTGLSNATALIQFRALPGREYLVQQRGSLTSGTWQTITNRTPVTGEELMSVTEELGGNNTQRFYRVLLRPTP